MASPSAARKSDAGLPTSPPAAAGRGEASQQFDVELVGRKLSLRVNFAPLETQTSGVLGGSPVAGDGRQRIGESANE